ncbi:MAG TPA: hypothetical protein PK719_07520 [Bacteroidales bacterium]|jgi:hypothetical protein|nr:hypothetical protein [Bacteroidales bacterium]OQB63726.1 MAG: hypothetical protein BWX96_01007 [Bacteroidetes bacterium ADurb.Bin145]HOU01340.1 hypothetical protein [Bacteroidales bacterium]HQG63492.1 hypothetical protein [Bacteroidales bacterium]HQK67423.1 hypothetical protein [Bacteroidales bacterium]
MTVNRIVSSILSLIIWSSVSLAQELNISPYSIFGIGDIHLSETGRTTGMASALTGLSGGQLLNTANPAALATLDTNTFIFDMTGSAKGSLYNSGGLTQGSLGANFNRISAGLHITSRWSGAVTIQPYSTVNYKVKREDFIEGSQNKISTFYEGSGGVNRISLLNSFRLTKSLSIGADFMMLFGNINRDVTQSEVKIRENSLGNSFSFTAGTFYWTKLSENLNFSAGLTYGYGTDLRFKNSLTVISKEGSIIFNEDIESSRMKSPANWGAGASLHTRRFIVAADYRYQKWSMLYGSKADRRFTDTHMANIGAEYAPGVNSGRTYARSFKYEAGLSVSNSFLTINGINPINFELTAGAAIPLRTGGQVNASIGWGKRGTTDKGLIREDYLRLTLSISLAERMFLKRMYD